MKASSLAEIKKELQTLDHEVLMDVCMRLAKYKKENKELLTYLLFEAHHEQAYIDSIKEEIEEHFKTLPQGNVYYIKKSLRKILRFVNRQVKYSGIKQTELELRIFFCFCIRRDKIPLHKSAVLANLYEQQMKKINTLFTKLPEDIQADYEREMDQLETR